VLLVLLLVQSLLLLVLLLLVLLLPLLWPVAAHAVLPTECSSWRTCSAKAKKCRVACWGPRNGRLAGAGLTTSDGDCIRRDLCTFNQCLCRRIPAALAVHVCRACAHGECSFTN